ncbi:phosphoribosylanthranilate isomerase [Bacillus massilinigeriensis]|uniref:phosphoribosylanthranilate isomerase n=1 Tax=Bacillus massilionigeriensis TaxID=1805475 RepID=UPI00096B2E15|nr:phosphoribosylanthranilate isomerase [Bacillus massilionigeriensis]
MLVKICGIMDMETARFAVETGADALGFVFAESKRRITIEQAKAIIDQLPESLLKVGVFVNEDLLTIENIIKETGINIVQLHGDETPEYCNRVSVPVVKAISVASKHDLINALNYPCEYILFDSPKEKYRGGNGKSFNWDLLEDFNREGKKIILAGGLNEDNVDEAIIRVKPDMVDVSSGVETNGKKDFRKIKTFIEKANKVQREEVR